MFTSEYISISVGSIVFSVFYLILMVINHFFDRRKPGITYIPDWSYLFNKISCYNITKNYIKALCSDVTSYIRKDSEKPLKFKRYSCDVQSIFGTNKDGYSIFISLVRKPHRVSEVILVFTLPDGSCYQLPKQPATTYYDGSSETWIGGGLSLNVMEPFERWRIVFNGILSKTDSSSNIDSKEFFQHVRLSFIWIAGSEPFLVPNNESINLLADCVLSEPRDNLMKDSVLTFLQKGYDQFGSLCGFVKYNDSEEQTTISMYGLRKRRWQSKEKKLCRCLIISASTMDGFVYNIEIELLNVTQFKYGNIRTPDGTILVIDTIDIDLKTLEDYSNLPNTLLVKFSSNFKTIALSLKLNKNQVKNYNMEWPNKLRNYIVPFDIEVNGYSGSGFLQILYEYDCDSTQPQEKYIPHLRWLKVKEVDEEIPICALFDEKVSKCPNFVGGKGASLALLASVNTDMYTVPYGFCLTKRALDIQIQQNVKLKETIKEIENVINNYSDLILQECCNRAVEIFKSTPICKLVQDEIYHHFNLMWQSGKMHGISLAIRSSGIGEDSEELSAAGQNATILGCKSMQDILCGIQCCWASLFAHQSVEYRRQHGQEVYCGMGVVVQDIVETTTAGVMFSRHPNHGDPSFILISSNYGLGESVVSGHVEPDTIILKRDIHDNLKVKSVQVGKKGQKIVIDHLGKTPGTQILDMDSNESDLMSISEEQCLLLGKIAIQQESLWGCSRDIEWGIFKGKIFLLQTRPITSLNSFTEFELVHELDTSVMSEDDLITFANVGEVIPGCISPLSLSAFARAFDYAMNVYLGRKPKKNHLQTVSNTHLHLGFNVFNSVHYLPEEDGSLRCKTNDLSLFGHIVTDKKMYSIALHRNGDNILYNSIRSFIRIIRCVWSSKANSEEAVILAKTFNIDLSNCTSALEMYNVINKDIIYLQHSSLRHIGTSLAGMLSQTILFLTLLGGDTDFTPENFQDIGAILSTRTNIVSAEVPTILRKISKSIQASGKSKEFCEQNPEAVVLWLKENLPDVSCMFDSFLENFGHRCIKEFDFLAEPWIVNPVPIIETLQRSMDTDSKNDIVYKNTEEIISQLVTPVSFLTRQLLKLIIPLCRKIVCRREASKDSLIKIVHKTRLAYQQLEKQMVKEWRFPAVGFICFMTHKELGRYLKTRNPSYLIKATLRKRYFPKWNKMKFPELMWGFVDNTNSSCENIAKGSGDKIITGTPVSSGNIVGRACVINSINEIGKLKSGDILITHSTDIGWSPYFPLLSGVVTELGGLISHGAVVAREYGLPCIVGAQNATTAFMTGDFVLLGGNTGTLELIERKTNVPLNTL